jgi:hypothetical protein
VKSVITSAVLLNSLLLSQVSLAQTAPVATPAPAASRVTFTDSSIGVRYRNEHDNNDKETKDQVQYNVDMHIQLRLDQDGKWKLMSRTETGKTFSTGWNDAGIGNNTTFSSAANVRQLYMQYESAGNTSSVGALPVIPNAQTKGAFSFDDDGWIDGARLESTHLGSWAKRVSVTVGRIDPANPSVFKRDIAAPNVVQIHVQGNIGKRVTYMLEGTEFNPALAPSEQTLRALVEIATKDTLHFIDKVVLETLVQNSDKPVQGFALSTQTALTSTWSLTAQYTHKGHEMTANESVYAPREDFYREGDQASLFLTKKLKLKQPTELGLSIGKTLRGPRANGSSNIGAFNSSGLRVDTKIKIKF